MITQLTNLLGLSPKGDVAEPAAKEKPQVAFSDVFEKMPENTPERDEQLDHNLGAAEDGDAVEASVSDIVEEGEADITKAPLAESDDWLAAQTETSAEFKTVPDKFVPDGQTFAGEDTKFTDAPVVKANLGPAAMPTLASMLVHAPSDTSGPTKALVPGQAIVNGHDALAKAKLGTPTVTLSGMSVSEDPANPQVGRPQAPEAEGWTPFRPAKGSSGYVGEQAVPSALGGRVNEPISPDMNDARTVLDQRNAQEAPTAEVSTVHDASPRPVQGNPESGPHIRPLAADAGMLAGPSVESGLNTVAQPMRPASQLATSFSPAEQTAVVASQPQAMPSTPSKIELPAGMVSLGGQEKPPMEAVQPAMMAGPPLSGAEPLPRVSPADLAPEQASAPSNIKPVVTGATGLEKGAVPVGAKAPVDASPVPVDASKVAAVQNPIRLESSATTQANPTLKPEPAQSPLEQGQAASVPTSKATDMPVEIRYVGPAGRPDLSKPPIQPDAGTPAKVEMILDKPAQQIAAQTQSQPQTATDSVLYQGRTAEPHLAQNGRILAGDSPEPRMTPMATVAPASVGQPAALVEDARAIIPQSVQFAESLTSKPFEAVSETPAQVAQFVRGSETTVNAAVIAQPMVAAAATVAPKEVQDPSGREAIKRTAREERQAPTAQTTSAYSAAEVKSPTSAAASIQLATAQVTNPALMDPSTVQTEAKPMEFAAAFTPEDVRPQAQAGVSLPTGTSGARENAAAVLRQMNDMLPRLSEGSIDIRLSPEELGKVRMQLVPSDQGMTVHIQADRPETLDLLRRHVDQLAKDLSDAGFESTGFTFAGGQSQDDSDGEPSGFGDGGTTSAAVIDPQIIEETSQISQPNDGLDIRV